MPSYGTRYTAVQSAMGGMSMSICKEDFWGSLQLVTREITGSDDPSPLVPPAFTQNPAELKDAFQRANYSQSLREWLVGTKPATFTKVYGPDWIQINNNGLLSGTPQKVDVGINGAVVRVCEIGGGCGELAVKIKVNAVNSAPVWPNPPVNLGVIKTKQLFQANLLKYVTDSDGDPITCEIMLGPSWLKMQGACELTGTPSDSNTGRLFLGVKAYDDKGRWSFSFINGYILRWGLIHSQN